ncbi:NAD-dependent protein deacylase [Bacillus marasmi]|uniref:NAD-dependent protein deacylase n=1 Tax=Bacillus marasmi TaxID=1926279 RepID=UPI001C9CBE74|nr:NAD-dependent protein deacylase [Bacillus marasmi]
MNEQTRLCTDIIQRAKNIVVLTGAGISTESGINDFRSRTGLYQKAPETILSIDYFYQHPDEFYQFAFEHLYHPDAEPNDGHKILAKWEKEGRVSTIITQNIDGLHQKAGSAHVIEFHGTMKTASCQNCGSKYSAEQMVERKRVMPDYYVCDKCNTRDKRERYIKPDVVLFGDTGEWFSDKGFHTILSQIEQADLLLVLGSSLKVTPFSYFPEYRSAGVPLIIINIGETRYDIQDDTYVIRESIGETLKQMV